MSAGLSYSNYSLLRSCGMKYRLKVLENLPEPRSVAFAFGSAMHAGLHTALETKDVDEAQDVFKAYWDSVQEGLDYKGERYDATAHEQMGFKFIANFTRKYAKDMELITGEKRLYTRAYLDWSMDGLPHVDLEGTPDALVRWRGKNVLLDFKTSAYNYDTLKTEVSLQLNLYARLLEKEHEVDEVCYFVFNKGTGTVQTPHPIPYNKEKALLMVSDMLKYFLTNRKLLDRNPNACIVGKQVCPFINRCWGRDESKTESTETVLEASNESTAGVQEAVRVP